MAFITLTTPTNKEVVLNTTHILTIEESRTGGTAIYFYDKSPPIEFVEKPNQVISLLRTAGENVVT